MRGLRLHAALICEADDRRELERLWGYVTGSALAHKQVQGNFEG